MSSFGELEYCQTDVPIFKPLDPNVIAQDHVNFPISQMQPIYFVAKSFEHAKNQITEYCDNIQRPFNVSYNVKTQTIEIDRKIKTYAENIEDLPVF